MNHPLDSYRILNVTVDVVRGLVRREEKMVRDTKTRLGENGRLVIPAPYRKALGLQTGDEVVLRLVDGELRVMSRRAAIKQVQDLIRSRGGEGRLLSEELLAERRAEAARE